MNYLLAASLSLILFYAVYWLLLRRLSFHAWNRAYLLVSLGISLGLPGMRVLLFMLPEVSSETLPASWPLTVAPDEQVPVAFQVAPPQAPGVDWGWLGWGLYGVGATLATFRLGRRLWRIRRLGRQDGEELDGLLIVPTTGSNASFFSLILLNETDLTPAERVQVLAHERCHAR